MVSVRAYITAGILVIAGIATGKGLAQVPPTLPADQNVQMNIRQESFAPRSAVTHKVNVMLAAVDRVGSEVAWEASEVIVRRIDSNGDVDATWSEDRPDFDTTDGLWWIDHASPLAPTTDEFTVIPPIVGTAVAWDPSDTDMLYELEGSPYVAPLQGALFPVTESLTYMLAADDTPQEPEADGDDDPIELPDPPQDPYGA